MVDYGYEEASPDVDRYNDGYYGYGDAAPDISATTADLYGYGDAVPDSAAASADSYGYGDAAPDVASASASASQSMYYDYGDNDRQAAGQASSETTRCVGVRSDMKRAGGGRRRASISYQGEAPHRFDDNNKYGYEDATPNDNDDRKLKSRSSSSTELGRRMGRRSSMKQAGAPRRSSITFSGEVSNILPGHANPQRRRTSIVFNESTEIKEVEPVMDLTDTPKELWFQKDEFGAIREKARLLTSIARESQAEPSADRKKFCFRGLESHIDSAYVAKEQNLAWKSVFLEQYHQRNGGSFNEEVVAQVYEMATMPSRARALERAAEDTKDAQKHTRGVRNAMRRHSLLL